MRESYVLPDLSMMEFGLQQMKQTCKIQEEEYWDVSSFLSSQTTVLTFSPDTTYGICSKLTFFSEDGFLVEVCFKNFGDSCPKYFNGYVTIPPCYPFVLELALHMDYNEFQYLSGFMAVELTFSSKSNKFGWDHAHSHDADFRYDRHQQPFAFGNDHLKFSGPVQILKEAIEFMDCIRRLESTLALSKKKIMTHMLYQELMEKALQPSRIQKWTEHSMELVA